MKTICDKTNWLIALCLFFLVVGCGSSKKGPGLEGKWECFKIERKSGCDTISNGDKMTCIPDPWIITSSQMEIVYGDPVNYVRKDSIIYIKLYPYYKIERLAKDTLVLLEIYCDNKADCESNEKYDSWDRRYFKRIK